jgi:hypothetical protein
LGIGWLVAMLIVGCAYPIALLITLFTPSVREYYRTAKIAG